MNLEFDSIERGFGDLDVLNRVTATVESGSLVGLVGPNGAGKTTLLRTASGALTPDEGEVRVDGDRVHALSSAAASRRVAVVPQETAMSFDFTVREVVEMGRHPHTPRFGRDPDPEHVDTAMARTEVREFEDRSITAVSGGERKRVLLARALAQDAPVLLLDEPTAGLDVNHQIRTLELVSDLVSEGRTALAAIHDLDLAARYCDRIAVLADGDLLATGPPAEVLTDARIRTAFDAEAAVLSNPVTGTPTVTPLPTATGELDRRVHVAGGGQAAARTVATLAAAGATVTAGVLPADDVAARTAADLGVETVTAPPFAPVDAPTEAAAREHLASAAVAVLAGTAPPAVRALVRDHDRVVRVTGDGTADATDEAVAAVAVASPDAVVDAVRRALDRPVAADD